MIVELNIKYITMDKKPDNKFSADLEKLAKKHKLKLEGRGRSGAGQESRTYSAKE